MSIRDAYRQEITAQVEELSAQLALARARTKRLAAATKIAASEEIADAEKKLIALKARLATNAKAGEAALKDVKGGVDKAWANLSKAAKRALKRFD